VSTNTAATTNLFFGDKRIFTRFLFNLVKFCITLFLALKGSLRLIIDQ